METPWRLDQTPTNYAPALHRHGAHLRKYMMKTVTHKVGAFVISAHVLWRHRCKGADPAEEDAEEVS